MRLIPPTESLHRSYLDAVDEFGGAHRDGDGLWQWIDAEGAVQPYTRAEMESDEGFHDFIVRRTDPDRDLLRGWVPCTFLWMEQDGEYVGSLAIRHDLNDFLAAEGGHIGYSVRPSARRRGHATDSSTTAPQPITLSQRYARLSPANTPITISCPTSIRLGYLPQVFHRKRITLPRIPAGVMIRAQRFSYKSSGIWLWFGHSSQNKRAASMKRPP